MKLPKHRFRRIQNSILDAYKSQDTLFIMLRLQLGEESFTFPDKTDLQTLVFKVIEWAESNYRVADLINGAYAGVPGNIMLQRLKEDSNAWILTQPSRSDNTLTQQPDFDRFTRMLEQVIGDSVQLNRLCHNHFPDVCERVADSIDLNIGAEALLDYCWDHPQRLGKLQQIIKGMDAELYGSFEPYLFTFGGQPIMVSKDLKYGDIHVILQELTEWKYIHNGVQELLSKFDGVLLRVERSRAKQDASSLEEAGYDWQDNCVVQFRILHIDCGSLTFVTNSASIIYFQEVTSETAIYEITEALMSKPAEFVFGELYRRLRDIRSCLWQVLTTADKRMLVLIGSLKGALPNA